MRLAGEPDGVQYWDGGDNPVNTPLPEKTEFNRQDYTPEFFQAMSELESTREAGEFYPGELRDIQDKIDAERTLSEVAKGRGFVPAKMMPDDWKVLANELKGEAGDDLRAATLSGRQAEANRAVGRHFIGGKRQEFIQVGGKSIERQWAGGSRKKAEQAIKQINRETKRDAEDFMRLKLSEFGYDASALESMSWTRLRRLLAEIGHGELQQGNISGVSRKLRNQIIERTTPKQKVGALSVAFNPRAGVGMEKWTHYEMSMIKAGLEDSIEYPPSLHETNIPDFVLKPDNKRPTITFSLDDIDEIDF